jgi:hypothetical protein
MPSRQAGGIRSIYYTILVAFSPPRIVEFSLRKVMAVAARETTDDMCIGMISIENERSIIRL